MFPLLNPQFPNAAPFALDLNKHFGLSLYFECLPLSDETQILSENYQMHLTLCFDRQKCHVPKHIYATYAGNKQALTFAIKYDYGLFFKRTLTNFPTSIYFITCFYHTASCQLIIFA